MVVFFNTCFAGAIGQNEEQASEKSEELAHQYDTQGLVWQPVPLAQFKPITRQKTKDEGLQTPGSDLPEKQRILIAACNKDEKSWIRDGATNSLFGTYLKVALESGGMNPRLD
ncbi:MAG: hypothetical protein ACFFC7_17365 [Candidatus Hermodarchaeota archaeon]